MPLIYDYLTASGDGRWYLPPQWFDAQLTNNPGFSTTAPEAVIRKASMLEGPASGPSSEPGTTPASRTRVKTAAANKPTTAKATPPAAN
jgi:hypothetical protein